MNNKSITTKRWHILTTILCFALILLCVTLFIMRGPISNYVSEWKFTANRFDPDDTASAFTYSLAYNRTNSMKAFVDEKYWPFLDDWATVHQQVPNECKEPDDPDLGPYSIASYDDTTGIYDISYFFIYECPYLYSLHTNTSLKMIDRRWKIVDWQDICEQRGNLKEKCYSK